MLGDLTPDETLTAIHLYRRDVTSAGLPPKDQALEAGLEERARAGDRQAQETLLLYLQDYIQYWAGRLARAYRWAAPRIDFEDLVSIANVAAWGRMERAKTREHMYAYLAATAKYAMVQYCKPHLSLITTPHDDVGRTLTPHQVLSLDRKLHSDDELTLGECIAGPDILLTNTSPNEEAAERDARNLETLRQVFPSLPEQQQQVLTSLYGLDGQEPKTHTQLANERAAKSDGSTSRSWVNSTRVRALRQLRSLLGTTTEEDIQALQKRRERHKERLERFGTTEQQRLRQQEANARYRAKLRAEADPEKKERQRQQAQARNARFLAQVYADPQKHEHYLQRMRAYRARKRAKAESEGSA